MVQTTIDLRSYRGLKRLLLVFAPSPAALSYRQQVGMLANQGAELEDRDLLVFYLFEEGPGYMRETRLIPEVGDRLRRQFEIEPGDFTLILMGKDGGLKFRADRPVAPVDIFSLIDILPMRQQELRQRRIKSRN